MKQKFSDMTFGKIATAFVIASVPCIVFEAYHVFRHLPQGIVVSFIDSVFIALLITGAYNGYGIIAAAIFRTCNWVLQRMCRLDTRVDFIGYLHRRKPAIILSVVLLLTGVSIGIIRFFYRSFVDGRMIAWSLFIILGTMVWFTVLLSRWLFNQNGGGVQKTASNRKVAERVFFRLIDPFLIPGYIIGIAIWINRSWIEQVVNVRAWIIASAWALLTLVIAAKWNPTWLTKGVVLILSVILVFTSSLAVSSLPHLFTPISQHGIITPHLLRIFNKLTLSGHLHLGVIDGGSASRFKRGFDRPVLPEDFDFETWVQAECQSKSFDLEEGDRILAESDDWNILLLTIDALRADHLSCYGYPYQTTPFIDRLAVNSVLFERCYAQGGDSIFSLNSILSGKLPWNFKDRIDLMLAEILADKGLLTGYVGYDYVLEGGAFREGFKFLELLSGNREEVWGKTTSKQIVDRIIELIKRFNGRQFFIYSHLLDPHADYVVNSETSRFDGSPHREYDGEIAFTDLHLGRLFRYLRDEGLLAKTVIIITADHGEAFGEHGNYWHGRYLYDESVHIPLLIHVPGISGRRISFPIGVVHLAPTILDIQHFPEKAKMDGISLLPLILQNDPLNLGPVEMVILNPMYKKHAVIYGPWKYIKNEIAGTEELYHLIQDPGESINLIGQTEL